MSSVYAFGGGSGSGSGGGTVITGPLSGFGELETVTPSPTSQTAFVYTVNPESVLVYTYGAGASISALNGEAVISSGATADGYARLLAKRVVNYRPGQGTMIRATARFAPGSAGNRQTVGVYNIEAGYRFGYDGATFGIFHLATAAAEVQTLTITAPVTAPGNVTVTLDAGIGIVVPVAATASTAVTASQIAAASYSAASLGWDAMAVGSVVYFVRRVAGPAGASTFAAGGTGVVGAFAILTTGVNPTETFIPQANWSVDTMGAGAINPSGQTLNPQTGNVYQIQYQYLGYGDAFFSIENAATGKFTPVHLIQNANARTSTNLRNPNAYVTWESKNTGTAASVTMFGASGAGFTEGPISFLGPFRSALASKTAGAGVETPILSLRATRVYTSRLSTAQIQWDRITVACDGTKTVEFRVYRNATLTGAQWARVNATTSIADTDSAATAVAGGTLVYAFSVAKTSSSTESFESLSQFIQAGDVITLTAFSVNANDVSATIAWVED